MKMPKLSAEAVAKLCASLTLLSILTTVSLWWMITKPPIVDEVALRIENYKMQVAAHVRDPKAVQWHKFHRYNSGAICGEFNIKNAFGGYTGLQSFIYVPGGVKAVWPHPFLGQHTVQHGWLVTQFEFPNNIQVFIDAYTKLCRNIPTIEPDNRNRPIDVRTLPHVKAALRSKGWSAGGRGLEDLITILCLVFVVGLIVVNLGKMGK